MILTKALTGIAIAATFVITASSVGASTVVTASSSGWIRADESSDTSGFGTGINNNFTGFEGQAYSNWFEFTLPGASVTSAVLSIYNFSANTTVDPDALYSVHAASFYTFAGLSSGVSFGSITLGVADDGTDHWVDINFNAAGIAFINANLGSTVQFGGDTVSIVDPSTCSDCVAAFGYSDGTPAATLTLDGAVPEPASWALMVAGFGLMGIAMRRRGVAFAA
jgi:hypothetical protein